jgi:tetratricopeptide (TPR) repeat protein
MVTIKNSASAGLISILALSLVLTGCMPREQRALRDGMNLFDRGKYPEAAEQLAIAASDIGTNAQVWNYLGLAWHHAGQITNAIDAYKKGLAIDHDLSEAHFNLGCLWLEQNRLDAAKLEFTAYTLRRGNTAEGCAKLGTVQWRSRDYAGAEKHFNDALAIEPRQPEALNGLGLIQLQRNRPREAAQLFGNALKQQPDYAPALLNLAIVAQVHLKDRPLALQKYREYLALPISPPNRKEIEAAARSLELELAPVERPEANNIAAAARARPVEVKATTNESAHVVSKPQPPTNPTKVATAAPTNSPAAKAGQGTTSMPPAAVTAKTQPVNTAAANAPVKESAEGRPAPGRVVAQNTPRTEAPKAAAIKTPAASGITADPNLPRYRYLSPAPPTAGDHSAAEAAFSQGAQAQQANRVSEAIEAYRRATRLDPAYYDAYYNLGLAATTAGNWQQALNAYEMALAVREESLDARYNFALLLKRVNFLIDAANEFERLLVVHPDEPRAHLALGNLYAQQLKQPARAREHYQRVLEIDPRNPQALAIRDWLTAKQP